jgi:hypothetical protein
VAPLTVVFLSLAALYESWSIPVAVILVVPLGVLGAVLATFLRGLSNDVFFQVGLLTTIGLSAKNAILIVEFAKENFEKGMPNSDDFVRLCHGRHAAGHIKWGWIWRSKCNRNRHHWRHAFRHGLGHLFRATLFRGHSAIVQSETEDLKRRPFTATEHDGSDPGTLVDRIRHLIQNGRPAVPV